MTTGSRSAKCRSRIAAAVVAAAVGVNLRRGRLVAMATAVVSLAVAAGAFGAVGDLSPQGCISDGGDPAGCGTTAEGLAAAFGVAVSPDGGSAYVASNGDDAIVRFDRAANGALSNPSCIEDPEFNGACDDVGAAGEAQGLNDARAVAVSPDGENVYVVGFSDDAVVRFDRAANGALSNPSCIEDVETNGPCDDVGPAGEAQGLDEVRGIGVSPDGASVYTASDGDDAIVRFDRAANGALSNPSCIEDVETNGPCDDVGPAGEAQGLSGAVGIAVSPDGGSLYATASSSDHAIVRFDRAANGALSNPSCIEDVETNGSCDDVGPAGEAQGLNFVRLAAVSPDGASVYAGSSGDNAIVRFDRAANGALSNPSCIADVGEAGCGTTAEGLGSAFSVAVSPDGASVYAASTSDAAIVRFDRAPSGALSNSSCISDVGDPGDCGTTAQGLSGATGMTVSPDGLSVYVASQSDNAIVRFDRELLSPPATATPQPEPQPEPLAKADGTLTIDANKGKVEKGRKVTLTGQLDVAANESCEPGRQIQIQRRLKSEDDSKFATFETVQTDATGNYSLKAKVKKTRFYRAVVAENESCDDETSNSQKVRVQKKRAAQEA